MSNRKQRRENRTGSADFDPKNSRKHRRAMRRQAVKCSFKGVMYNPGEKVSDGKSPAFTAGGSYKMW